jgi:uncharacterized protein with von Willebrand factor type A (vWA) domain
MRELDDVELAQLAQLAGHAPELQALAEAAGLAQEIDLAAHAVARRLVGVPLTEPGAFGSLLFAVASAELQLLEHICHKDPLRASASTITFLSEVLRNYPRKAASHEATEPDDASAELRAELEQLMQRRLPDGFPLPVNASAGSRPRQRRARTVVEAGADLAEAMQVAQAGATAFATAMQCDELMLGLGALLPGFGWDYSTGHLRRSLLGRFEHLSELLGRLPVLRRIANELGRMEASQRTRRRAEGGGREAVVGVRVGGELADVLPCELALLSTPETEDLFYQRLIEKRLVCLELQGTTTEAFTVDEQRGPAIACIDTSGSMSGAPEAVAKALILVVTRRLVAQRRALQLLLFGGPGEYRTVELRPGIAGLEAMLDFLRLGFFAGTDYDGPLRRALELLRTDDYARADVLVVTDGLCRASADVVHEVAAAKKRARARFLTVIIGGDPRGVDNFSDHTWIVDPTASIEGGFDLHTWNRG